MTPPASKGCAASSLFSTATAEVHCRPIATSGADQPSQGQQHGRAIAASPAFDSNSGRSAAATTAAAASASCRRQQPMLQEMPDEEGVENCHEQSNPSPSTAPAPAPAPSESKAASTSAVTAVCGSSEAQAQGQGRKSQKQANQAQVKGVQLQGWPR